MRFHLTLKSSNKKTGPIPVSTSSKDTCPSSCPLSGSKGACYANLGPLGLHWRKITDGSNRSISFDTLLSFIRKLPKGQLWRHNQAGDLPGIDEDIDEPMLKALVEANKGKLGFTYTHKKTNPDLLQWASSEGFTVNVSSDSLTEAYDWFNKGFPTTVVVPHDYKDGSDHKVRVCPAVVGTSDSCDTCRLCARANRKVIVAFPAHGSRKKLIKVPNEITPT